MTLRSRFTLAMLLVTAFGILLASGIILSASTRTILAKSEDSLLVSCESVVEAYGSFLSENNRVVERIAASPTFGQLLGSGGISRMIAMKSAEAEVALLLSSRSGIDAIEIIEEGTRILSLPRDFPWPSIAPAGAAGDEASGKVAGAPGGPWYVSIEKIASDGKGKIRALVDLAHFGRTGVVPLIAKGGVDAFIMIPSSTLPIWNSAFAPGEDAAMPSMPRPDPLEFMRYTRNGVDRIACRIERGGLAFVAEISREALFVDLSRFTRLAALAAVLLLATGMMAAILISRRLTGSISSLVGAARRIADKDYRFELDIHTGDEMEVLYSAFKDMGGEIERFTTDLEVLVAARTVELNSRMEEIERLMVTDTLTGIANRRKAGDFLERETARTSRYGNSLSLILFDIDHFKAVNDRYGHGMGDAVLTGVARAAAGVLRPVDLVARWGGEEFLVILPETELDGGLSAGEKIRCAIQDAVFPEGVKVTVSVGVAQYVPDEAADALVARADAAMYESKRKGRNTTSCARKESS